MDDVYVNWNGQESPMDFLTVHGYGWGSDPIEWNHGRPDRIDRGLDWDALYNYYRSRGESLPGNH